MLMHIMVQHTHQVYFIRIEHNQRVHYIMYEVNDLPQRQTLSDCGLMVVLCRCYGNWTSSGGV